MTDPSPARIQPLTPATAATDKALNVPTPPVYDGPLAPAAGGWTPPGWAPYLAGAVISGITAALPFASGPAVVVLTVALGICTGLGVMLGIKSAGPRKL